MNGAPRTRLVGALSTLGLLILAVSITWWLAFYGLVVQELGGAPIDLVRALPCLVANSGACDAAIADALSKGELAYNAIFLWAAAALIVLGMVAPKPFQDRIADFIDRRSLAAFLILAAVAAVTLFAMMMLTFADVWGRYLLNQPVFGGYEVTEFMMGVLIFTALPMLCAREGHVTIDLLDHFVPKSWLRWQRVTVNFISGVVLGVMAWRVGQLSEQLARNSEVTMTLKIPHAPFALVFAIMAACAAVACFIVTWGYLNDTRKVADSPAA